MASFLSELHYWTIRHNTAAPELDIGYHCYHDKGETASGDQPYYNEHQHYIESCDMIWTPRNKRPDKLRDTLKEFEELLTTNKCVLTKWKGRHHLQLFLSNACFVTMFVAAHSGDVERIIIDKSLQAKLSADTINDALVTDHYLVFAFPTLAKLALVQLSRKPGTGEVSRRPERVEKLSALDPKISYVDLPGPTGRRVERRLSMNTLQDMVIVWWPTASEEAWPWSPMSSEKDRANLVLLSYNGVKLELLCYIRTECEPISAHFSLNQPHRVYTVEKSSNVDGKPTVDSCIYECSKNKVQRVAVTTIPLKSPVVGQGRNPAEDKLVLSCEDRSLVLYDDHRRVTECTQAMFPAPFLSWHPSGCVFAISNHRGEIQILDMALGTINIQLLAEEPCSQLTLNTTRHFRNAAQLERLQWTPATAMSSSSDWTGDCYDSVLLMFDKGPLALLRFHLGVFSRGRLGAQELISEFLKSGQVDQGVDLLNALNWNTAGDTCLTCLNMIFHHLMKQKLNAEREAQLEMCLGSFYAPTRPLTEVIVLTYRDPISRLARRFFHHLLRYQRFEKAFLLAVDIGARDLFMDIHYLALDNGETALADVARKKAEEIELESVTTDQSNEGFEEGDINEELSEDQLDSMQNGHGAEGGEHKGRRYLSPAQRRMQKHRPEEQDNISQATDISDYPYPEEEGGLPPEMYTAALLEDPMSWPHDQENMAEGGSDEDEDDVDKTASTLEVIHFGLV
ncbi:WD repeat-containing and planar cell polarity effector protein fritz homolog [Branchiostoma floridae]|uniref:WD repeat-containing and planar cell polarity effector protein fritz homolog n=1 Tax=Branchiostoma floridae TaxID=7739 RepID=A0A9J7MSQ6_BRAFL|nr:WD repeat-containing and planar cell polarity effector protein fritz homolog [Branchiostoma floridae]XP_035679553.1 WD repeat-containing and planar cell polarity effector protein fritz homolog [Branchiostoma floridae]XP_035679562.1 WD repeat-containing and planar cell polarity effector protein fritz homolog [Branchiostoma floridae]